MHLYGILHMVFVSLAQKGYCGADKGAEEAITMKNWSNFLSEKRLQYVGLFHL